MGQFLARLLVTAGLFELEEGRGPGTDRLDEAQAILDKVQPTVDGLDFRIGWTSLRNIQFHKAERAVERGEDAAAKLQDLERTLKASRPYRMANEWPGDFANFSELLSVFREAKSGDALGPLQEARQVLKAARKDYPHLPRLLVAEARLLLREAQVNAALGTPWRLQAENAVRLLRESGRTHPEGLVPLAQAHLLQVSHGHGGARALAMARESLRAAQTRGLKTYPVWVAHARLELAELRLSKAGDPHKAEGFRRCAEALAQAEARSPGSMACARLRAELARSRAEASLP
jgi:hypothetical protein